ncbi:DinB family protein [Kitasatospora sp. NBC_00315]|uniref:DinB family protein n=1 Tax=Kitasatospora sp. NBC_00315 TaxID=2975963 RepID=UPI003256231E
MNRTPGLTRTDAPYAADEFAMLAAFLDFQRATLAMKCEGLTDDQLRLRAVPPSGLSLLGLVRHMSEVERAWYQIHLLGAEPGEGGLYWTPQDEDGEFTGVDDADVAEAFATWRTQTELSRRACEGLPLETVARRKRKGSDVTLRWIQVHMIEEYARHNGHADLLRELVDGSTGE